MMLTDSAWVEVWVATRVVTSLEHVQYQQLVSQFADVVITSASVFTGPPQSAHHRPALSTTGDTRHIMHEPSIPLLLDGATRCKRRRHLTFSYIVVRCVGLSVGAAWIAGQDRSMWRTLRPSAGQAQQ